MCTCGDRVTQSLYSLPACPFRNLMSRQLRSHTKFFRQRIRRGAHRVRTLSVICLQVSSEGPIYLSASAGPIAAHIHTHASTHLHTHVHTCTIHAHMPAHAPTMLFSLSITYISISAPQLLLKYWCIASRKPRSHDRLNSSWGPKWPKTER